MVRILIKSPFDLAYYFCKGNGLEIGALSSPYVFGRGCSVKYADIYEAKTLQHILSMIPIPSLYRGTFVTIDFLLKPPRFGLEMICSNSFDFVFSSHSLEHTPNPIWALTESLRVTKPAGVVYVIIPNKKYTYDARRLSTPIEKLIEKYERLDFSHSFEEALDVVLNTMSHPLYDQNKNKAAIYAQEILDKKEGIHHFYVFDERNTLEMLLFIAKTTCASVEYFAASKGRDIHFALRKKSS